MGVSPECRQISQFNENFPADIGLVEDDIIKDLCSYAQSPPLPDVEQSRIRAKLEKQLKHTLPCELSNLYYGDQESRINFKKDTEITSLTGLFITKSYKRSEIDGRLFYSLSVCEENDEIFVAINDNGPTIDAAGGFEPTDTWHYFDANGKFLNSGEYPSALISAFTDATTASAGFCVCELGPELTPAGAPFNVSRHRKFGSRTMGFLRELGDAGKPFPQDRYDRFADSNESGIVYFLMNTANRLFSPALHPSFTDEAESNDIVKFDLKTKTILEDTLILVQSDSNYTCGGDCSIQGLVTWKGLGTSAPFEVYNPIYVNISNVVYSRGVASSGNVVQKFDSTLTGTGSFSSLTANIGADDNFIIDDFHYNKETDNIGVIATSKHTNNVRYCVLNSSFGFVQSWTNIESSSGVPFDVHQGAPFRDLHLIRGIRIDSNDKAVVAVDENIASFTPRSHDMICYDGGTIVWNSRNLSYPMDIRASSLFCGVQYQDIPNNSLSDEDMNFIRQINTYKKINTTTGEEVWSRIIPFYSGIFNFQTGAGQTPRRFDDVNTGPNSLVVTTPTEYDFKDAYYGL